jgi:hypothetical protein
MTPIERWEPTEAGRAVLSTEQALAHERMTNRDLRRKMLRIQMSAERAMMLGVSIVQHWNGAWEIGGGMYSPNILEALEAWGTEHYGSEDWWP